GATPSYGPGRSENEVANKCFVHCRKLFPCRGRVDALPNSLEHLSGRQPGLSQGLEPFLREEPVRARRIVSSRLPCARRERNQGPSRLHGGKTAAACALAGERVVSARVEDDEGHTSGLQKLLYLGCLHAIQSDFRSRVTLEVDRNQKVLAAYLRPVSQK